MKTKNLVSDKIEIPEDLFQKLLLTWEEYKNIDLQDLNLKKDLEIKKLEIENLTLKIKLLELSQTKICQDLENLKIKKQQIQQKSEQIAKEIQEKVGADIRTGAILTETREWVSDDFLKNKKG